MGFSIRFAVFNLGWALLWTRCREQVERGHRSRTSAAGSGRSRLNGVTSEEQAE